MDAKTRVMNWARAHARPIPAPALGCPCGCMTKRPYMIDPACMLVAWPIREDPVCGPCGAVLDPDGSCFVYYGRGLDDAHA